MVGTVVLIPRFQAMEIQLIIVSSATDPLEEICMYNDNVENAVDVIMIQII